MSARLRRSRPARYGSGIAVALIALAGTPAESQPQPEANGSSRQAPETAAPAGPFTRGATSVEFGVGVLGEAWNPNEGHEWIAEGGASMWWAFAEGFALGAEFQHARVFQATPNAFVQGLSPLVRWRFFERPAWQMYLEVGPGISWSDRPTPPRGTRFNYLFQSETGVMTRLARNTQAVIAFRFLHVSNNGREGLDHNPDIEGLGLRAGVAISF